MAAIPAVAVDAVQAAAVVVPVVPAAVVVPAVPAAVVVPVVLVAVVVLVVQAVDADRAAVVVREEIAGDVGQGVTTKIQVLSSA